MNGNARTYEGMFLLEAGKGDFETASEPVRTVLSRNEAEILSIKPWDERKLAYDIAGHKRGLYVLTFFKADPAKVAEIERDCQLSENVLRSLLLHKAQLTEDQINAPTPATSAALRAEALAAATAEAAAKAAAQTGNGADARPDASPPEDADADKDKA